MIKNQEKKKKLELDLKINEIHKDNITGEATIQNNLSIKEFIPLPQLTKEISIKDLQALLTHAVLIDNVIKQKELKNNSKDNNSVDNQNQDYSNISSYIASIAVIQTVQNVANYFKALANYWKTYADNKKQNSVGNTVKASPPQLPNYLDKNERFTFELHRQRFSQSGTLFTINPKKHKIYSNFYNPDNSLINLEIIEKFNSYNFLADIEKELESKINKHSFLSPKYKGNNPSQSLLKPKTKYELQTVRFVSLRKSKNVSNEELLKLRGKYKKELKIEAVVKIETDIADDSPLAKVITYFNQIKTLKENDNNYDIKVKLLGKNFKEDKEFLELTDKQQEKIVKAFLESNNYIPTNKGLSQSNINLNIGSINNENKNKKNSLARYGGLDLGKRNIASLALTHGDNIVYSGQYINQHLTHLNSKLDEIKASIFKSSLSEELVEKVLYNREINELNNFQYQYDNNQQLNTEKLNNYLAKRDNFIKKHNLKKEDGSDYTITDKLDKKELNKEEQKEIREANKKVYQNINYLKVLIKMENFKS